MSTPATNIKFQWTDDDGINEYQCPIDPAISWKYNDLKYTQTIGNQLTVDDWIGVQVIFNLDWMEPRFFKGEQYYQLAKMFNSFSTICFFPDPDTFPNACFLTKISGGFNFDLVRGGKVYGWEGKMTLEGTEVLESIPLTSILTCNP